MAEAYFYTTRDEVEVVRCKDCKHFDKDKNDDLPGCGYCKMIKCYMDFRGFCSFAERKEQ